MNTMNEVRKALDAYFADPSYMNGEDLVDALLETDVMGDQGDGLIVWTDDSGLGINVYDLDIQEEPILRCVWSGDMDDDHELIDCRT